MQSLLFSISENKLPKEAFFYERIYTEFIEFPEFQFPEIGVRSGEKTPKKVGDFLKLKNHFENRGVSPPAERPIFKKLTPQKQGGLVPQISCKPVNLSLYSLMFLKNSETADGEEKVEKVTRVMKFTRNSTECQGICRVYVLGPQGGLDFSWIHSGFTLDALWIQ